MRCRQGMPLLIAISLKIAYLEAGLVSNVSSIQTRCNLYATWKSSEASLLHGSTKLCAGDMTKQLRAHAVLPEDPNLDPRSQSLVAYHPKRTRLKKFGKFQDSQGLSLRLCKQTFLRVRRLFSGAACKLSRDPQVQGL